MTTEHEEDRPDNHRRLLVMAAVAIPVVALFAVLGIALGRSGGVPAGVAVNSLFGEVEVGDDVARDFTLTLFSGEELRLSDLRGQVVMVDFWASWCPPCRQESPTLAAAYSRYKAQGVEFLGVVIWDSEEVVRAYVQDVGLTYPIGMDSKGAIAIDYGLTGIPEKYFIDREGKIFRKFVGPVSDEDLDRVLSELLQAD